MSLGHGCVTNMKSSLKMISKNNVLANKFEPRGK